MVLQILTRALIGPCKRGRLWLCGSLVLTACTAQAPGSKPRAPSNVLLITIDTLRADRVGRGLTPAIDALAARGFRFTNARAVVPLTLPSHVAIMTGMLPGSTGVHLNGAGGLASGQPTLARALKSDGYRTGAFVGAYVLDHRFGLNDGFDVYDDRVERDPSGAALLEAQRRGDKVVDAALTWLKTADSRPFFAWIHLYDPHTPYDPPPDYLARAKNNAYDGEVAFADAQVARVLEWLKTSGRAERTVVAITGDHGEGLGDHGEATHGMLLYDSTLRVPLVIAGPNVGVGSMDEPASLADLAVTLLALSGAEIPRPMRRLSMFQPHSEYETYGETDYPRSAGWHTLTALTFDRWKLIVSSETELYDLAADPGETRNLADDRRSLVDGARKRLTELRESRTQGPSAPIAPEAAERLRALGYVSGNDTNTRARSTGSRSSRPSTSSGRPEALEGRAASRDDDNAPNPAKHIAAWNSFERELARLTHGDPRRALPGLLALARRYPDAPIFQSTYARALKDTGRVSEALVVYRRAVARWPRNADLYHDLAVVAVAAGDTKEAARAEQAALALEPSNAAASNGLGLLYAQNGRTADAVKAFERAVKEDPSNATFWTNLGNARRDAGNTGAAEEAYRRALDLDPRSADAANGIGVLLVQAKRAAEAIPWFERALAAAPELLEARLNLGIAYQESGNREKALEQYQRVLETARPGSKESQAARALLQ